jgi:phosphoribosylaminoimidazole (AIR) synthetase
MMIEMEFEAHSQMYDIINQGIEMDIILGDENEEDSIYRLSKVEEKLKIDQLEKGEKKLSNSWASKEK